jgi:hypothetical protein
MGIKLNRTLCNCLYAVRFANIFSDQMQFLLPAVNTFFFSVNYIPAILMYRVFHVRIFKPCTEHFHLLSM